MSEPYFHHGLNGLRLFDDDPCPHDCATGIGTIDTVSIPLGTPVGSMLVPAARTIWECTECHATGEDTDDGRIVWADVE